MTCRRASEIDLPGFLDEPWRPEHAEFRAHYPRCRECAAEVRAWSALREALRASRGSASPAHPDPEQLARYEEAPREFAPAERRALETHLAACAACRDELRALRAFDPASLAGPSAARAVAPERGRSGGAGFLEGLRRLLWQPALAYALLLALALPTLYRQIVVEAPAPVARAPATPRVEEKREQPAPARPAAPPPALATPGDARTRTADAATSPNASPAREGERQVARLRARAPEPQAPGKDAATPAAGVLAPERAGGRVATAERDEAPEMLASEEMPSSGLALRPGAVPRVAAAGVALRLSVMLPRTLAREGEVEVRIVGPDGRRELRERRMLAAGAVAVPVEVPAGWLAAGRHEVTLQVLEEGRAVAAESYGFDVGPVER